MLELLSLVGIFMILLSIAIFYYIVSGKFRYIPFLPHVVVPAEEEWIVERLGEDRVLKEGPHNILPLYDKIIDEHKVNMKEIRSDPPPQEIITKDNIKLEIDVLAWIKVKDSLKAINSINNYNESVKAVISASVFTILGNMNLETIQENVNDLTKDIKKDAEKTVNSWGVYIINIVIENMKPPQAIEAAMEEEIVQDTKAKTAIKAAEAEHKVMELHADSEKILIEKRAEATHKIIRDLKELMPDISDEKIMNFLTSTSYIDSMKALSSSENSKFVVYPSEIKNSMDQMMGTEYMSQAMDANKKTAKAN